MLFLPNLSQHTLPPYPLLLLLLLPLTINLTIPITSTIFSLPLLPQQRNSDPDRGLIIMIIIVDGETDRFAIIAFSVITARSEHGQAHGARLGIEEGVC
jgi:hypothetical protein